MTGGRHRATGRARATRRRPAHNGPENARDRGSPARSAGGTTTLEHPPPPAPGALGRAGARGALWQGAAQAVAKTVVLITTVLLARLLSPEEYGLVALALVLMAYAEAIADAGVAQALVYLPRRPAFTRAALLLSTVFGCLLVVLALAAAPMVAEFFGHADVAPLVRLLALSLFASSLGAVPEALLRRELRFPRLTSAMVIRAVVTGAVTIGLALDGWGAWSLAWGTVAGSVSYTVSLWVLLPERGHHQFWRAERAEVRMVLGYGTPVAGSSLLAKLIFDVDYLIVGGLLGAQALGHYTLAFRMPELLIINVFFVIATVTFPLYARARRDPDRLRSGYLQSVRVQSLYGICAGVGLAVVAPYLVPVLFGPAWVPAITPLILLALYAAVRSVGAGANEVYKALGRPGLSVQLSLARLVILVPVLIVASRWGIEGIAAAQLLVAVVFAVGMQTLAARVMDLRSAELVRAAAPALACGLTVGLVGAILTVWQPAPLIGLIVGVPAGVAAVGAVLTFKYPSVLPNLFGLVRGR